MSRRPNPSVPRSGCREASPQRGIVEAIEAKGSFTPSGVAGLPNCEVVLVGGAWGTLARILADGSVDGVLGRIGSHGGLANLEVGEGGRVLAWGPHPPYLADVRKDLSTVEHPIPLHPWGAAWVGSMVPLSDGRYAVAALSSRGLPRANPRPWKPSPVFQVVDTAGRIIRWQVEAEPIPPGEWRAYAEERERLLGLEPANRPFTPPRNTHPHPDWQPYYGGEGHAADYEPGFQVDEEGNLWIGRYRRQSLFRTWSTHRPIRPPERWWVFDAGGRWLGEIRTPENLLVKSIRGGLLLGISRTELDVEEVRGYRIDRGEVDR